MKATRDLLVATTLRLIRGAKSPADVTVRRIIDEARTNLNAVNYHFGNKEALVREAVRSLIAEWFKKRALGPEGLRGKGVVANAALACSFLFEQPVAARLALDAELVDGGEGQSLTRETLEALLAEWRAAHPRTADGELRLRTFLLLSAAHQIFLRPALVREWLGRDVSDEHTRRVLLTRITSMLNR